MQECRQLHANTQSHTLTSRFSPHFALESQRLTRAIQTHCSDSQLLEFCGKKITCVSAFKSQHLRQPASSPCPPFIFAVFLLCVCLVCVSSGSQLNYWRRWCCAIGRSGRAGLQSQVPCFKHLISPGSSGPSRQLLARIRGTARWLERSVATRTHPSQLLIFHSHFYHISIPLCARTHTNTHTLLSCLAVSDPKASGRCWCASV